MFDSEERLQELIHRDPRSILNGIGVGHQCVGPEVRERGRRPARKPLPHFRLDAGDNAIGRLARRSVQGRRRN